MRSDYDTFLLISFILSESIMLHVFVTFCKQKLFVTKKLLCSVRIEPVACSIPSYTPALFSFLKGKYDRLTFFPPRDGFKP